MASSHRDTSSSEAGTPRDLYDILGVPKDATDDEIRKSYRRVVSHDSSNQNQAYTVFHAMNSKQNSLFRARTSEQNQGVPDKLLKKHMLFAPPQEDGDEAPSRPKAVKPGGLRRHLQGDHACLQGG
jgi:hypothetical protein